MHYVSAANARWVMSVLMYACAGSEQVGTFASVVYFSAKVFVSGVWWTHGTNGYDYCSCARSRARVRACACVRLCLYVPVLVDCTAGGHEALSLV